MSVRITFLGTGGGRHTTMYQTRCTGGMIMDHGSNPVHHLHIDPGPGALVQMNRIRYDLGKTESVIISHAHPDHYSDAPSVIEGMTRGGWKKRGHVYGSPSVIDGDGGLGPCLSPYHLGLVEGVQVFRPGDVLDVDGMQVDICKAQHSDPTNVGFRFHTEAGIISYVSDTEYTDEIARQYIGSRVLILPVTTPHANQIKFHLCTDTAIEFCKIVKPELCIFIHLGIVMIRQGPAGQAQMCQQATGIRTVAGEDLMVLDAGDDLQLSRARTHTGEWYPRWSPQMPGKSGGRSPRGGGDRSRGERSRNQSPRTPAAEAAPAGTPAGTEEPHRRGRRSHHRGRGGRGRGSSGGEAPPAAPPVR